MSARREELLEAAYAYVLEHGLADVSLRPLAAAIGTSPRVLLFLFGSKDELVRELLARARRDELAMLERVSPDAAPEQVWAWLAADEHRALLGLWLEAYSRSVLAGDDGPWAGFAGATVDDWLGLLGGDATLTLAVLRGALLDLLATGDVSRCGAAVARGLAWARAGEQPQGPPFDAPHRSALPSACPRAGTRLAMEARLHNGVPQTAGWFVVNARDTQWLHDDMRSRARFGGEGEAHFDDLGIGLYVIEPGRPMALYHHEAGQEDFLLLKGEALLIVEGQERPLRPFDLFHCPPRTPHTIVGAGTRPALILAVGARKEKGSARYPVDATATKHEAGVTDGETPDEAYARWGEPRPGPPPPGLEW